MQPEKQTQEERRKSPEIQEIKARLDEGDRRMAMLEQNLVANTEATKAIAENTAGLVRLTTELEAGTRFLCRCAMAVRFLLKEIIEPFWKPVLFVGLVIYYVTHDHQFPLWIDKALKALGA